MSAADAILRVAGVVCFIIALAHVLLGGLRGAPPLCAPYLARHTGGRSGATRAMNHGRNPPRGIPDRCSVGDDKRVPQHFHIGPLYFGVGRSISRLVC